MVVRGSKLFREVEDAENWGTSGVGKRRRVMTGGPNIVLAKDFRIIETPHPYGILPAGNRFLCDENSDASEKNHAISPLTLLSDEGWYAVMEFLDARDLGRLLQTCRYFYATGSEPELWRDLVLRKQEGKKVLDVVGPTWKDTYILLQDPSYASRLPGRRQTMAVSGTVYSDFYYRLHSCRLFSIPPCWESSETDTVDRVPFEQMTMKLFEDKYERPNIPVVVEGAAKSWKAFERWQDPSYFKKHVEEKKTYRATSGAAPLPCHFRWSSYYDYCRSELLEEAPLYLFDRAALSPGSVLWNDYMKDLQRTCPYWDPERNDTSHDLFKLIGEGRRPDHTWLIVGPKRSGSVFHIDPNATHAWNATIVGKKRWIFYPPGVTPPGVLPSEDGDHVALPLSLGEWIFQFWDEHVRRTKTAPPSERPLECTALPGDILFVPHGWWHLVVNESDLNIAITHNYVSESNLSSVLKFLSEKEDQVSGCRDRPDSIKPERLYTEFVEALKSHDTDLVEKALADPDWSCKAWTTPSRGATVASGSSELCQSSVLARAMNSEDGTSFSFSFL